MKIIISYILSFVQFIVGLTGLELLFEYKQTHPDFTLNIETITLLIISSLVTYPASISVLKYWDGVLGNKH